MKYIKQSSANWFDNKYIFGLKHQQFWQNNCPFVYDKSNDHTGQFIIKSPQPKDECKHGCLDGCHPIVQPVPGQVPPHSLACVHTYVTAQVRPSFTQIATHQQQLYHAIVRLLNPESKCDTYHIHPDRCTMHLGKNLDASDHDFTVKACVYHYYFLTKIKDELFLVFQ